MSTQVQVVTSTLIGQLCIGGPYSSFLRLNNELEWLKELRKAEYLLDYQLTMLEHYSGTGQMEQVHRVRYRGGGAVFSCPL